MLQAYLWTEAINGSFETTEVQTKTWQEREKMFSAPAQTSIRPTWLRPSVWVPPLGTVVLGTHASRGPEGRTQKHTQTQSTHCTREWYRINIKNPLELQKKLFSVYLYYKKVWFEIYLSVLFSGVRPVLVFLVSVSCTCDVRFSLSRILSFTSLTSDAML